MPSRAAMARFDNPSASTWSTSSSRGVGASYSSGSTLANRHLQLFRAISANNADGHRLSHPLLGQQIEQVLRIINMLTIEGNDAVANTKTPAVGRAAGLHVDDEQCALIVAQPHRLAGDAEISAADAAVLEEGGGGLPGNCCGDDHAEPADLGRGCDADARSG